jgi:hypothetical protein
VKRWLNRCGLGSVRFYSSSDMQMNKRWFPYVQD